MEDATGKTEVHLEAVEVAAEEEVVVGIPTMMMVTTAAMIGIVTVDVGVDTMMIMVVAVVVEEEAAEGEVMVEAEAEAERATVAIDTILVAVVEDMALQGPQDLQDLRRCLIIMDQALLVGMGHPLQ